MEKLKKVFARNGVPVKVAGFRKGRCSMVEFLHTCCDCGLKHDVSIKHGGKCPNVDITFTRKKREE